MEADNTDFSFIEPNGHNKPDTKIERYWKKFNGPYSLYRKRVSQFSVYAGMTHSPLKYTMKRFKLDLSVPSDEWIISAKF